MADIEYIPRSWLGLSLCDDEDIWWILNRWKHHKLRWKKEPSGNKQQQYKQT